MNKQVSGGGGGPAVMTCWHAHCTPRHDTNPPIPYSKSRWRLSTDPPHWTHVYKVYAAYLPPPFLRPFSPTPPYSESSSPPPPPSLKRRLLCDSHNAPKQSPAPWLTPPAAAARSKAVCGNQKPSTSPSAHHQPHTGGAYPRPAGRLHRTGPTAAVRVPGPRH